VKRLKENYNKYKKYFRVALFLPSQTSGAEVTSVPSYYDSPCIIQKGI